MDFDESSSLRGLVRSVSGKILRRPSNEDLNASNKKDCPTQEQIEEDMESLECRVCRGEPEPGKSLYAPCLCSGSIMYIHKQCLEQWLSHSKKYSCELCGYTFTFAPVYKPGSPKTLPFWILAYSCTKILLVNWIPKLFRVALALFLWIIVVPLATSWLYRMWIHRSRVLLPALFMQRLTPACILDDCVSGAIIAGAIILSFLSLMTFADFIADQIVLREDWDNDIEVNEPNNNRRNDDNNAQINEIINDAEIVNEEQENNVDNQEAFDLIPPPPLAMVDINRPAVVGNRARFRPVDDRRRVPERIEEEGLNRHRARASVNDINQEYGNENERQEEENIARERAQREEAEARIAEQNNINNMEGPAGGPPLAFNELFGLAGNIVLLPKYILWLLAFNGAYLGLFAFIPYSVGASMGNALSKYLNGVGWLKDMMLPFSNVLGSTNGNVTAADDHTLQFGDLATICLGYGVLSVMVFTWRVVICAVCQRTAVPALQRGRRATKVLAAVVKVGLLLSLKMIILPLLLAGFLDIAALPLFASTVQDRIQFLINNSAGSLLLHWVLGITFMLVVTVSVLQLREVFHPDILAGIIRPQEPHPDLLGSLLQERGRTHARRMAMSLATYVALVMLFVWLPSRLAVILAPNWIPFELRLRYFVPQLQIPIELIAFHLVMLIFLEKHKDMVGLKQHQWLVTWCKRLGLTRYLLPLPVLNRISNRDHERARILLGDSVVEIDENGLVIGEPLVRPPKGWDDPVGPSQNRWAWAGEQKGQIEQNLAPRKKPNNRFGTFLPVMVLIIMSWCYTLVYCAATICFPFFLGRGFFFLLGVPPQYAHDPFGFVIGLGIIRMISPIIPTSEAARKKFTRNLRSLSLTPTSFGILAVVWTFWGIVLPCSIVSFCRAVFFLNWESWRDKGVYSISPFPYPGYIFVAFLALHLFVLACKMGFVDLVAGWLAGKGWGHRQDSMEWRWYVVGIIATHKAILFGVPSANDNLNGRYPIILMKIFMLPLARFILVSSIKPLALSFAACRILHGLASIESQLFYFGLMGCAFVLTRKVDCYFLYLSISEIASRVVRSHVPTRTLTLIVFESWIRAYKMIEKTNGGKAFTGIVMGFVNMPFERKQVIVFRLITAFYFAMYFTKIFKKPAKKWMKAIHDSVRDEWYLQELRLQNHPEAILRMHKNAFTEDQ